MIEKTGIIELEGMEFHAFHGVLESEKIEGNLFLVDFKGEVEKIGRASCRERV